MRWFADENFNNDIIRGFRRRAPNLDLIRVQEVGLKGADDPTVLAWAAEHDRILLSHDVTTITAHAYDRLEAGQPLPGVIEVTPGARIGQVIDDLLLIEDCADDDEFSGQIIYLPFR